jgi:hypothetical protein
MDSKPSNLATGASILQWMQQLWALTGIWDWCPQSVGVLRDVVGLSLSLLFLNFMGQRRIPLLHVPAGIPVGRDPQAGVELAWEEHILCGGAMAVCGCV